jgi:hypothetical protein
VQHDKSVAELPGLLKRFHRLAGHSRDQWKRHWPAFLVLAAAGGALFVAGSILLIKGTAEPPSAETAAPPVPAQPQAAMTAPPPASEPPAAVVVSPPPAPPKLPDVVETTAKAPEPVLPPADPPEAPKRKAGPHVDVHRAMYNCSTEIGMLCSAFKDKPWSAVKCLKAHQESVMPACAKSLGPVDDDTP